MAIPAVLIEEAATERRDAERYRVRIGARWLDSGPVVQRLTIRDLSTSGFLLETDGPLKIRSYLIVDIPGEFSKICMTVWQSGTLHGVTFSEPLSEQQLQNLISLGNLGKTVRPQSALSANSEKVSSEMTTSYDIAYGADERLPVGVAIAVILGMSVSLWSIIIGGIWVAIN